MTNTEKTWELIAELYGEFQHKEGIALEKIKKLWDNELNNYSWDSIEKAIEDDYSYDKRKTQPTLAHLRIRLKRSGRARNCNNDIFQIQTIEELREGHNKFLTFKKLYGKMFIKNNRAFLWINFKTTIFKLAKEFSKNNPPLAYQHFIKNDHQRVDLFFQYELEATNIILETEKGIKLKGGGEWDLQKETRLTAPTKEEIIDIIN